MAADTPDLPDLPHLPDLVNLRDVGGLQAGDGGRVRRGVLYRSATPYFIDGAQAEHLVQTLGVRLRVDLRSRAEVAEATNPCLAAVERQVLHVPLRSRAQAARLDTDPSLSEGVARYYLGYLEHTPEALLALVEALAGRDGTPALLHCTAGKDRTGVAVAVLLQILGVPDDVIVADYARTRDHLEPLFDQLTRLPAYDERIANVPAEARTAEPETMAAFLRMLEEQHGGAEEYLTSRGLAPGVLDRLRGALVERG